MKRPLFIGFGVGLVLALCIAAVPTFGPIVTFNNLDPNHFTSNNFIVGINTDLFVGEGGTDVFVNESSVSNPNFQSATGYVWSTESDTNIVLELDQSILDWSAISTDAKQDASAVLDALDALGLGDAGDIIYRGPSGWTILSASGVPDGRVLKKDSGFPAWGTDLIGEGGSGDDVYINHVDVLNPNFTNATGYTWSLSDSNVTLTLNQALLDLVADPNMYQEPLGFEPQIGSENLTNWAALVTFQKQDSSENLTNWSNTAVTEKQDTLGFEPQPASENLTNWSAIATSVKQDASANLDAWSAIATSVKQDASANLDAWSALSTSVKMDTDAVAASTDWEVPGDLTGPTITELNDGLAARLLFSVFDDYIDEPFSYSSLRRFSAFQLDAPSRLDTLSVTNDTVALDWNGPPKVKIYPTTDTLILSEINLPTDADVTYQRSIDIINTNAFTVQINNVSGWVSARGIVAEVVPPGETVYYAVSANDGNVVYEWSSKEDNPLGSGLGGTGNFGVTQDKILVGRGNNPMAQYALGDSFEFTSIEGVQTIALKAAAGIGVEALEFEGATAGADAWTNATALVSNTTTHIKQFIALTDPADPDNDATFDALATYRFDAGGITVTNDVRSATSGSVTLNYTTNSAAQPVLQIVGANAQSLIASVFIDRIWSQVFEPITDLWSNLLFHETFDVAGFDNTPSNGAAAGDPDSTVDPFSGMSWRFTDADDTTTVRWVLVDTAVSELAGAFAFWMGDYHTGSRLILDLASSTTGTAGTAHGRLNIESDGKLRVRASGSTGQQFSVASVPTNQWVTIWFHAISSDDSETNDAYFRVGFSTDGSKPTGDNVATVTGGSENALLGNVRLYPPNVDIGVMQFDEIRFLQPGSNWDDLPASF